MDLETVLWEKIIKKSEKSLHKLVHAFFASDKYKSQMISAIVLIYVQHFLNNNLYLLSNICKLVEKKTKDMCINIIYTFISVLSENNDTNTFLVPILTKQDRDFIITLSTEYESESFNEDFDRNYKHLMNGNIYNLVCTLVKQSKKSFNYKIHFQVITYILTLKKHQIFFQKDTKILVSNILFNVCNYIAEFHNNFESKQFIYLCQKLYSYNKHIHKLIYIAFFVTVKNEVVYFQNKILDAQDFLFTLHPLTQHIKEQKTCSDPIVRVLNISYDSPPNLMCDIIKR